MDKGEAKADKMGNNNSGAGGFSGLALEDRSCKDKSRKDKSRKDKSRKDKSFKDLSFGDLAVFDTDKGFFQKDGTLNIGILGGSFDPPHLGHVWLGDLFLKSKIIHKLLYMPTYLPPHKVKGDFTGADDRAEMCRLAAMSSNFCNFIEVSLFELELGEKTGKASFTVDTIGQLKKQEATFLRDLSKGLAFNQPPYKINWFLIMGADMFLTLRTWKNYNQLREMVTFCTLPRDDHTFESLKEFARELNYEGASCVVLNAEEKDISSTEIRNAFIKGEKAAAQKLLPETVFDYIAEKKLYLKDEKMTETKNGQEFVSVVKGRLSQERFEHSLNVANLSRELALKFGEDPDKAFIAGVLHDIMKEEPLAAQLQMLEDFGIITDNLVEKYDGEAALKKGKKVFKWLHALTGSVFINKVLKVADQDIINAVKYHTTGRAGMSMLEKIVYIADMTSADRDYPDVEIVRGLIDTNIDYAILYCLKFTMNKLVEKNLTIHIDTVEGYNYFVKICTSGGKTDC